MIKNMKQNKAWLGAFAFVIMAGISMLTFAFKAESKRLAPADGWYTINITNPSQPELPANQDIGSLIGTPPVTDPDGCAQTQNTGNKCAVYLTFTDEDATLPATVAEANADPDVTVGGSSRSPE
jgi:hypothetical protein